jgi:hypothetical protein
MSAGAISASTACKDAIPCKRPMLLCVSARF